MKSTILIALLFVTITTTHAQSWWIGLYAAGGTTRNTHLYPNYQNKLYGYWGTGLQVLRITRSGWVYGLDAGYGAEGARLELYNTTPVENTLDIKARLQYLRSTLKVGYCFSKPTTRWQLLATTGPCIGHLTRGYEVHNLTLPEQVVHFESDVTHLFDTRTDVGLQTSIGAGYKLFPKTMLTAEWLFYQGFKDTWSNYRKNSHTAIRVGIGWRITASRKTQISKQGQ